MRVCLFAIFVSSGVAACSGGGGGGSASPTPTPVVIDVGTNGIRAIAVPDLTGDGQVDLAVTFVAANVTGVAVYAGPISATSDTAFATFSMPENVSLGNASLAAHDVLGGPAPDLVTAALFDGRVFAIEGPVAAGGHALLDEAVILHGDAGAFFGSSLASGAIGPGGVPALAIGSPGEPEEACFSGTGADILTLPLTSGAAAALASANTAGLDPFTCPGAWMAVSDFDDDGADDLLVTSTDGGSWVFAGPLSGARPLAEATHLATVSNVYGYPFASPGLLLDADGDGDADIALRDGTELDLAIHAVPLDGAEPQHITLPDGLAIPLDTTPGRADLDGDGRDDLVLIDDEFTITSIGVIFATSLEDGDASEADFVFDETVTSISVGDVTGDGRADLLTITPSGLRIRSF